MGAVRDKWLYSWGIVCLTAVLSIAGFYVLYRCNNKYTAGGEKAVNGVLLAREKSGRIPLYYLSHEWEYYPDVLLTPEDDREDYYSRFVSVGEFGGMELDDRNGSPFGSGTYRLLLVLPETERTYSLFLPEIFSAYRLYIAGKMAGQAGNPEPEHYKECIRERIFTFRASGTVELMIAVTDRSSFSSGMAYIPVFGTERSVNTLRDIRIFVDCMRFAAVLSVLLFSLYFCVRNREISSVLFALVCLCVLGYTSYPLLHTYLPLAVWPWYGLESFFYFMMFPLLILLEDVLLGTTGRMTAVLVSVTAGFGILAFAVSGLFVYAESAAWMYRISFMTECMKWLAASYMLLRAVYSPNTGHSQILIWGVTVYACSLIGDRLWPAYQPVIGGWFPEFGGIVLAGGMGGILWSSLSKAYRFQLTYAEYSRQMELRLKMQQEHYTEISRKIEEVNQTRHDLRQHMRILAEFSRNRQYRELETYLEKFTEGTQPYVKTVCYCSNMAVDAVLHYYGNHLERAGADTELRVELPQNTRVADEDLVRIFGNLLENALESVKRQDPSDKKYVSCIGKIKNQKLLLEVKNSYSHTIKKEGYFFCSTSRGGIGSGIESVRNAAARYGGYADFQFVPGEFQVKIFIPV